MKKIPVGHTFWNDIALVCERSSSSSSSGSRVGFIHYNLKHGYFYVDYSIELNVGNGKEHELKH